jgi:hypothetical protein
MAAYFDRIAELNEQFRRARRSYLIVGGIVMGGTLTAIVALLVIRNWGLLLSALLAVIGVGTLGDPLGNYRLAWQEKLITLPYVTMSVELDTATLIIAMGSVRAEIPLENVRTGRFVSEASAEGRGGLSPALYLDVGAPQELIVPEVARGFHELMSWLKANRRIEQECVI